MRRLPSKNGDLAYRVACILEERDCISSRMNVNTCKANRMECHKAIGRLPSKSSIHLVTQNSDNFFGVDGMRLPFKNEASAYRAACTLEEQDCIASRTNVNTCRVNRMECHKAIGRLISKG
ncbi:hypothetical protein M422DRAFT_27882 [Sphaerobolus stellatus SS14]|nr:hypothetical protein M422DRAFT_27882 [Sphaerobolus stellatus SS14]